MTNQESIDELWPRVEPGIRQLVPSMSHVHLLKTKAMINRVLRNSLGSVDVSTLDYAEKYLAAGKLDIAAAEILLTAKQFTLSVYHIQQAAEKAMKAYCLGLGALTDKQVRRSHRTPQLILRTIEKWPGSEMNSIFSSITNRDYRKLSKEAVKLVNSDLTGQQQLAKLPLKSDKRELTIELLLRLYDQLLKANSFLDHEEDQVKEVLARCLPEYAGSIMNYSFVKYGQAAGQCYILGALTFLHENYTRYPGGYLEPQDYTEHLGIVEAAPELIQKIAVASNLVAEVITISRKQAQQKR